MKLCAYASGAHQDYANQIAQLFIGVELEISDLPRLAEIGRGKLRVDLLTDETTLDGNPIEPLNASDAARHWLERAIVRDQLKSDYVRGVSLTCEFAINAVEEADRSEHDTRLSCIVELDTLEGARTGTKRKRTLSTRSSGSPTWHTREVAYEEPTY